MPWLACLMERRPLRVAAVELANKIARMAWVVLVRGETATISFNSPLKKASLTGFHATAKHIAAKAVSPSSETMRTI